MGIVARRYTDFFIIHCITYPYYTCISSFLQHNLYFFVHLKNVISFLYVLFLCYIATLLKEHSRSFKNRDHVDMAITIITSMRTCARRPPVPRLLHTRYIVAANFQRANGEAVSTLHCALENGLDLHVNERQKI